jgi:TrmH family RNA methyltransferase
MLVFQQNAAKEAKKRRESNQSTRGREPSAIHSTLTALPLWVCRKIRTLISPAQADRLRVVLVKTRNPLNIGAAARAMSNFGFRRLRVVNPFEIAFREARSAVGATEVLASAEEYKSVTEAVADCTLVIGTTAGHNRQLQHPLRPLNQAAGIVRKQLQSGAAALLFGSEKVGLSKQDLSHCHWLIHIPTQEAHLSMNLGQAVAVCLYELARTATPEQSSTNSNRMTAGDAELITETLLDALRASGYVKGNSAAPIEDKARRLIRRLNLQSGDANILLGMLRQIVWKLTRQEKRPV